MNDGIAPRGGQSGWLARRFRIGREVRGKDPREQMEWQFVKILLIYRAVHVAQWSFSAPDLFAHLRPWPFPLFMVGAFAVETTWLVWRMTGLGSYGGAATALGELGTGMSLLAVAIMTFPPSGRVSLASPLLIMSTGQVSGAALARRRWLLAVGTGAMAVLYALLIEGGRPHVLFGPDVIVGISGYALLAVVFWHAAAYLRATAARLAEASAELERTAVKREIHDHFLSTLRLILRLDLADPKLAERLGGLRAALARDHARLRTFVDTGRFAERAGLVEAMHRLEEDVRLEGLHADVLISARARRIADDLPVDLVDFLESALRTALNNVLVHARQDRAAVTVDVEQGHVRASVADHGPGLPPDATWRGLAQVDQGARERGGGLAVRRDPGVTKVSLWVPVQAPGAPGARAEPAAARAEEPAR